MNKKYDEFKLLTEQRLTELLASDDADKSIKNAMSYSVMAGGKRLRPVLNLLGNSLLAGDPRETLDHACAIEFIHTYSLIHDDLPAMDNDDIRRGKPTSHVMFGEAFAILAGDALLNFAFETMIKNAMRYKTNILAHLSAMDVIAKSAGVQGMISGQCADIEQEGQIITEKELYFIHEHKTGAIIKSALLAGLLLCSPGSKEIKALEKYGNNIGLTFQITDDVLDIVGNEKLLGKTVGKDAASHKFTFPVLYGIDRSIKIAEEKTEEAIDALSIFGEKAEPLTELAKYIIVRKN